MIRATRRGDDAVISRSEASVHAAEGTRADDFYQESNANAFPIVLHRDTSRFQHDNPLHVICVLMPSEIIRSGHESWICGPGEAQEEGAGM